MRILHFIFAVAVSVLALFVTKTSQAVFVAAIFLGSVWCFAAFGLFRRANWAYFVSRGILGILFLFFSYQIIRRIIFVVQNGGMERADGYGSPLAFLLGLFFETACYTFELLLSLNRK